MIKVHSLTKIYSNGKGIRDVSFDVEEGEVFGFLGPNGAGKTTTLRHLMGFVNPSSGKSSINGLDCRREAAQIQKNLGYVPGEIAFYDNMTGMHFLEFIDDLRGRDDKSRRDQLINRFELDSGRKIRKMSKGMKQKVGLIAAFMHDPAVLILDEPTSGLDPLMQRRFVELIIEERNRGKTILMSSHLFDEVDHTCERVGIIREGSIVTVENINSLKRTLPKSVVVTLAHAEDMKVLQNNGLLYTELGHLRVEIKITDGYDQVLRVLSQCKVIDMECPPQTLEQIFMDFYGKEHI
ncbi:ABC transporter ATP-binding protein [Paenibacillus sp. FSL R5-0766]|uniref:ABC transporter ATP-binding protein n=1 Tax=unclassified Paenibacillus TaxID=185978 RepID=UPI00096EAA07|nr:ABC transporter ATP-binding protein [Paenibacillus sp. FSL R5-0765]OMF64295.1 ABC transporter ATP-binding protein [Paenibacillus sp. FSL R5-0765]